MKVFVNGSIYCIDNNENNASEIAWEGKEIIDIGSSVDIIGKYPNAEVVDLENKSAFPGFIDPHHHIFIGTLYSAAINLDPTQKILKNDILEMLKEAATGFDDKEWVVAYGYNPIKIKKGNPLSRKDLDDAVPNHLTQNSPRVSALRQRKET